MNGAPNIARIRLFLLAVTCWLCFVPAAHAIRPPSPAELQLKEETTCQQPLACWPDVMLDAEVCNGLLCVNDPLRYTDPTGLDYWGDVGGYFMGYYDVGAGFVTGTAHMVAHPINTAVGVGTAVAHPINTGKAIASGIEADWNGDARAHGRLVAGVLTAVAAVVAPEAEAGNLSKVNEVANVGEKAAATAKEAASPQYYIENGARRSVASREAGANEIPGTIFREGQSPENTTLNLDQLHSPKPEIPADPRFQNIKPPIQTPIQVQPMGTPGQLPTVPLNKVKIVPPGGQ